MDENLEDLKPGRIHLRDRWQFELKTEFFPLSYVRNNVQTQELYIFIPNSLRINDQTYTKDQFYQDQTNMIRLKTPTFTLEELINPQNSESPLAVIKHSIETNQDKSDHAFLSEIEEELKLLANIFHSALRNAMTDLIEELHSEGLDEGIFGKHVMNLCDAVDQFRMRFVLLKAEVEAAGLGENIKKHLGYIDEYISININDFFILFLNKLRQVGDMVKEPLDARVCSILENEKIYQEEFLSKKNHLDPEGKEKEFILYRKALLNKFVINPLLLKVNRSSVAQRFKGIIGGIPAAVAMFIYLLLFLWQGNVFLMNSEPFVLLTVVIYVLKDRIKEELRLLSYRQAAKWFADYATEIQSPFDNGVLGKVYDSFFFVDEQKIPKEIKEVRHREFHAVLEEIKRPEQVIYYKRTVNIKQKPEQLEKRFYGLSLIFRFDIHHFLSKAEDPIQDILDYDPPSGDLVHLKLPRVYHLNIILRSSLYLPDGTLKVDLLKYRLIIDKEGIKRVEHL